MAFNKPEFALIDNEIFEQLDNLEKYYNDFKEIHEEYFKDDIEDNFIDFTWSIIPEMTNDNRQKMTFGIQYSDKLPEAIKTEFSNYFDKYKSNT